MNKLEEAYKLFWDDMAALEILNHPQSLKEIFVYEQCNFLVEQNVLQDFHIANYSNRESNLQLDAWGLLPTDDASLISLALIVCDFRESEKLQSQSLTNFRQFIMKGKRVFTQALKSNFPVFNDEPISPLIDYVRCNVVKIESIRVVGITNTQVISKTNTLVLAEDSNDLSRVVYDVWDFSRWAKIIDSQSGRESVDIDFVADYEMTAGIPALAASGNTSDINSYLFVLPGKVLIEMYEKWNERLLEQNPRTFLQFTGKVNKGIRNTILNEPEYFFSYNNGISAVGNDIILNETTGNIERIGNFQIVNGGQTTASIYYTTLRATKANKDYDISKISVMVKLSIISDLEKADLIIPKISEFSNSQTKVPSSAFSVSHPFHERIENYSRSVWTPAKTGRVETHWFYERVQGQYRNAYNLKKTISERKIFERNNPKNQVIKREELAKYLLTFNLMPEKVSLGAQKCYARFCDSYLKVDEEGKGLVGPEINQFFFQEICAKALLFRSLEKRIKQDIRFVATPYTLALIVLSLRNQGLVFDYQKIWNAQWEIEELINEISKLSEIVILYLRSNMPSEFSLLSEWAKKEVCWNSVREIHVDTAGLHKFTTSVDSQEKLRKNAQLEGRVDQKIYTLEGIVKKGEHYWKRMYEWGVSTRLIDEKSLGILKTATNFRKYLPSDRQAAAIQKIEQAAIREGFNTKV